MGRTGGGGGHSSGGGHSMSHHSGGGHSMGGSHRSGGSSFGGSHRSGGSSFGGPRPSSFGGPRPGGYGGRREPMGGPIGGPRRPRRQRYYGGGGLGCGGFLGSILIVIIMLAVILYLFGRTFTASGSLSGGSSYSANEVASTMQRTKLESGNAYINDCVDDELGWCDSTSKMSSELKEFWDETGVQPYIILKDYDASLSSNDEMEEWTTDYYDENIDTENVFLLVYFDADSENEDGYWTYANGFETGTVMDSEAVEIFWSYLDSNWNNLSLSVDDALVQTFLATGDKIMTVSTTKEDVAKTRWVVIGVIALVGGIIIILQKKFKRDKEKAEEDQKILNTPINDMANTKADDLADKYTSDETSDSSEDSGTYTQQGGH